MIGSQDEAKTVPTCVGVRRTESGRIGECSRYLTGIEIVADKDPSFLSRVFGLLATLDLTPDYWYGTALDDQTQLTLRFKTSSAKKTDLLVRKLNQLTLIHDVSIYDGEKAPWLARE